MRLLLFGMYGGVIEVDHIDPRQPQAFQRTGFPPCDLTDAPACQVGTRRLAANAFGRAISDTSLSWIQKVSLVFPKDFVVVFR